MGSNVNKKHRVHELSRGSEWFLLHILNIFNELFIPDYFNH